MSKSNGSFITSNLSIASNIALTDRILVVYNAIANSSVGNGNTQTRTITLNNFINSFSNNISLMSLTNTVAFSPGNVSYKISILDCYVFINSNNQGNCNVILPSISANGKGYIIKKTSSNTLDTIIITTDSINCLIDNANSFTINSMAGVVKGKDGNFWLTGII